MNAAKTLDAAANHLRDRAAAYDSPGGERSAGKAAAAFNAITGRDLTAGDVYLLLAVLKAVRARQGSFKSDNYEDGAAYFALMGEADNAESEDQRNIKNSGAPICGNQNPYVGGLICDLEKGHHGDHCHGSKHPDVYRLQWKNES